MRAQGSQRRDDELVAPTARVSYACDPLALLTAEVLAGGPRIGGRSVLDLPPRRGLVERLVEWLGFRRKR